MFCNQRKNNLDAVTPDREIKTSRVFDAPRELSGFTYRSRTSCVVGPRGFTTNAEWTSGWAAAGGYHARSRWH